MVNYQEKLQKVLEYIESNLDTDLDIETLSSVAHLSKYHFHRQFTACYGIGVYSLIKKLRLKKASHQLAFRSEPKVIDIAHSSGYESSESFSRAFNQTFGQSPSGFRKNPDWIPWHEKYEPIIKLRNESMNDTPCVRIVVTP